MILPLLAWPPAFADEATAPPAAPTDTAPPAPTSAAPPAEAPPPTPAAPPAEAPPAPAAPPVEAPPAAPAPVLRISPRWGSFGISGYIQGQYQHSELSEDEVTPAGSPRNLDRFTLRSARLTLAWESRYVRAWIEPDFNTTDGPWVSPNNAAFEVRLPARAAKAPAPLAATVGLFDTPFGAELTESSAERPFMERTLGSRALFPGDHDLGAQLSGGLGPIRYAVAVVNGVPLQNSASDAWVYTAEKTVVGRVGFDAGVEERWAARGGASLLSGAGFHAGATATKPGLGWSDENQNGTVTLDELVGYASQAATPSETFQQWAVNVDLSGGFHTPLGWTELGVEGTLASNLDRGWLVADPVSTGYDLREIAWSARIIQDVTRWGLVGFRADAYDANSDAFDTRRGDFVPADVSVLTLSPVLGVVWPDVGRVLVQYDYTVDHLGRDALGEPRDLPNDQLTVRCQVSL